MLIRQINWECKGRMAASFAKLMKMMWYDDSKFVSPWDLKKIVGKYQTSFSGFSQQDSQELISAILDALHEDLNRVSVKPYIESISTENLNDDSISVESWNKHLARNQSIIVDLMHGQFKSISNCPKCNSFSVVFDPFSMISIPIPEETKVCLTFVYVPYNTAKQHIKCSIIAEKTAPVKVLREQISQLLGVHKDSFTLALISTNTFDRFMCRDRSIKHLHKLCTKSYSKLYALEINPMYFNGPENMGVDAKEQIEKERLAKLPKDDIQPMKDIEKNNEEHKYYSGGYGSANTWNQSYGINEVKKNKKKFEDHDDYNNGLVDDLLRVTLNIKQPKKSPYHSVYYEERITFCRIIYVKRSATLKDLHFEIFRYFRQLFEKKNILPKFDQNIPMSDDAPQKTLLSDEELFAKIFSGVDETNWEEKLKAQNDYPYLLKLINIAEKYYPSKEKCYYCGKDDCTNCVVPFLSSVKVSDLLSKVNDKQIMKNDFLYKNHGYSTYGKKEFELEMIFNQENDKCLFNLNDLENYDLHPKYADAQTNKSGGVSIYSCIEAFNKWETLDENNLWYCRKCQDSVQARKKMELFRVPPILIIHLKRFKTKETGRFGGSGDRLNTLVDFPLTGLDISQFTKTLDIKPIYDLYAVCNHIGSAGFGHYTAFGWNAFKKDWYKFDDSSVTQANPDDICTDNAYVLFYKRRDLPENIEYDKIKQMPPPEYKPKIIEVKPAAKPIVPNNINSSSFQQQERMEENKVLPNVTSTPVNNTNILPNSNDSDSTRTNN